MNNSDSIRYFSERAPSRDANMVRNESVFSAVRI